MATNQPLKPVNTIIFDAGPIIKGEPLVSTLLQQCEIALSTPAVIAEIRDKETRSRLETTLLPFLKLSTPKPESVQFVTEFARKTGDAAVLSRTDIQLLALTYDAECELNGGDWRLRRTPGQKRTNGPPPSAVSGSDKRSDIGSKVALTNTIEDGEDHNVESKDRAELRTVDDQVNESELDAQEIAAEDQAILESNLDTQLSAKVDELSVSHELEVQAQDILDDSDSEGWITPSNIRRKQIEDAKENSLGSAEPKVIQAV
jgi:RNA-binding protein NOB1